MHYCFQLGRLILLVSCISGLESFDFMDSSSGLNIKVIARYPILTARNARNEQPERPDWKQYYAYACGVAMDCFNTTVVFVVAIAVNAVSQTDMHSGRRERDMQI